MNARHSSPLARPQQLLLLSSTRAAPSRILDTRRFSPLPLLLSLLLLLSKHAAPPLFLNIRIARTLVLDTPFMLHVASSPYVFRAIQRHVARVRATSGDGPAQPGPADAAVATPLSSPRGYRLALTAGRCRGGPASPQPLLLATGSHLRRAGAVHAATLLATGLHLRQAGVAVALLSSPPPRLATGLP